MIVIAMTAVFGGIGVPYIFAHSFNIEQDGSLVSLVAVCSLNLLVVSGISV